MVLPSGNRHLLSRLESSVKNHPPMFACTTPGLYISIQSELSPSSSCRVLLLSVMNSFSTSALVAALGSRTYVQLPPANGCGGSLRSVMPLFGAQATCTVPVAGCTNSNTNWPGTPKVILVA